MTKRELLDAGIGCIVKKVAHKNKLMSRIKGDIGMVVMIDLWKLDNRRDEVLVTYGDYDIYEHPYSRVQWESLSDIELVRKADNDEIIEVFGELLERQEVYEKEYYD